MGHKSLSIKADAYLIHELAFLGRITGDRNVSDVVSGALSMTADALRKSADGYVIQIISQSIGRDQFYYPLHPQHMYQDMKGRKTTETCGDILLHKTAIVNDHLRVIRAAFKTTSNEDAVRFALHFANTVATQLQAPGGSRHLAYIDGNDRRFGYVAETPYDRTMKNQFNRLIHGVQSWLGKAPQQPPSCPPPNCPPNNPNGP
jgi:hypothetical protein